MYVYCSSSSGDTAVTDMFSPKQRSENMRRIRSYKTHPEEAVARTLKKLGMRYVRYDDHLAGTPDFVLRDSGRVVFVHGCFWHQHEGCGRKFMPKSKVGYWKEKLEGNVKRFDMVSRELRKMGRKVSVIWECETKDPAVLTRRVRRCAS